MTRGPPIRGQRRRRARGGRPKGSMTVSDVTSMARKAWQASKYIMSLINVETKVFDVTGSGTVGTSAILYNLSNIAQGNDYNNREGNSILSQGLELRYSLESSFTAANTAFVRVLLVADMDQHGSDPALGDLLETTSAGLSVCSPYLHYANKRFSILYDHTSALCTSAASCSQFYNVPLRYNKHVKYSGTTGADPSNWEGALYLFLIGTQGTYPCAYNFYHRLFFTDN